MKNLMIGLVIVLSFPCLCGVEPEKHSNAAIIKSQPAEPIHENCSICFDSLHIGQTVVLSCNHSLHVQCLRNMLEANGPGSERCPLCRRPIERQVQVLFGPQPAQGQQQPAIVPYPVPISCGSIGLLVVSLGLGYSVYRYFRSE